MWGFASIIASKMCWRVRGVWRRAKQYQTFLGSCLRALARVIMIKHVKHRQVSDLTGASTFRLAEFMASVVPEEHIPRWDQTGLPGSLDLKWVSAC